MVAAGVMAIASLVANDTTQPKLVAVMPVDEITFEDEDTGKIEQACRRLVPFDSLASPYPSSCVALPALCMPCAASINLFVEIECTSCIDPAEKRIFHRSCLKDLWVTFQVADLHIPTQKA